ncbi:MAG: hypothetical protein MUP67_12930 [Acidimicrobiia bacterium]|nr:hypothetical protein [Acidimicrobiia bacterium]
MQRRKAFATAGAVSVTALALVVALGANVGLFGLTRHDDGPGRFKLVGNTSASPSAVAPAGTSAPSATSSSGGQPTSDDHEAERPESGDEDD